MHHFKTKIQKKIPTPFVAFGHSFVLPHKEPPNEIPNYGPG